MYVVKGLYRKIAYRYTWEDILVIKPCKCDVCGKGFIQKNSLQTHMRRHTGDKPCQCDVCGKGFIQKNSLQTHMTRHTGDKTL
jgi:KRAB domain-containing zinc finger protein